MSETTPATISVESLQKGQVISGDLVWLHYTITHPDKLNAWLLQFGDESSAKLAKLPQVLLHTRDWIDHQRRQLQLPPLVMHTAGGQLNILDDAAASAYLNSQAYQGINKHRRATARLINAVDTTQLAPAERRAHDNRIGIHSFIASATQGAQRQLRLMERAGKTPPRLKGAEEVTG